MENYKGLMRDEIKAMGVAHGRFYPIRKGTVDEVRGMCLHLIIVPAENIKWWNKHKKILRECLSMNHDRKTGVIFVGDRED